MSTEKVFAVDESNRPMVARSRELALGEALWRRASGGLAIDPVRSLVLSHRRSIKKDERPGLWVLTFGGKNQPSEEASDAAKRELVEEFGLFGASIKIKFHKRIRSDSRRQFEYVFFVFVDSEHVQVCPDYEEVERYEWVDINIALKNLYNRKDSWYEYGYEREMLENYQKVWKSVMNNTDCNCTLPEKMPPLSV